MGIQIELNLQDRGRNRSIPLRIYVPDGPGPYPIILFSHGAGGSREGFVYLGEFWAENGYVSIHPTHIGSDTATLKLAGPQVLREESFNPQTWHDRAGDIRYILDSLMSLEQATPALVGKLDTGEIGMAGHSFGAYTTMLMAGTTVTTDQGTDTGFGDSRIKAFMAISPQGTGQQGLTRTSWKSLQSPMLFITGTEDRVPQSDVTYRWRTEPFEYCAPGHKYLAVIRGAQHFSFSDRGGQSPRGVRIQAVVRALSLSFWDAYLKHQTVAKAFLQSPEIETRTQGRVTFSRK